MSHSDFHDNLMPQNSQAFSAGAAAASQVEKPVYEPATVVRHIAHELRQPLSTIESIAFYLDMVLPRTEGKARKQLAKLQQEVHHINWILSDAIHFLQAAPLQPQLLDLTEVVAKSLSEWEDCEGFSVRLRLAPDLPPVEMDLEQVQHMLRNLVAFFGRICEAGGVIVLRTYAADREVVLEATTTATGLSSGDCDLLFAPFDARLPGGSGLGLASMRRIAEAHGARLETHTNRASGISLSVAFPASVQ
jgi:two-component system sensor histidine kinase BaeS